MKSIQRQLDLFSQDILPEQSTTPTNPLWAKIALCLILSSTALMASNPCVLTSLFLANTVLLVIFINKPLSIFKELKKMFVGQTVLICGLYFLKFGFLKGILPGFMVSLQILCAFLPGIIFLKSTPPSQIVQFLSGIMPYKLAFVLTTSLKFLPMLINEIRSIHEVQLLRGANVKARGIFFFWNWPDFINCVIVPATIKSMLMSKEIAIAAHARGFGAQEKRTFYPGVKPHQEIIRK